MKKTVRKNKVSEAEICGFKVEITRKNISVLRLRICRPNAEIKVSAPFFTSNEAIFRFVSGKLNWIRGKRAEVLALPRYLPAEYEDGESFCFFGERLRLSVREGKKRSFSVSDGEGILTVLSGDELPVREKVFFSGMRNLLREKISDRLPFWAGLTGLSPSGFTVRKMRSRWGSCSRRTKRLCFNFSMVHRNPELLDYLILHEIAHLRFSGHGSDFWGFVSCFMPDCKERRRELRREY